MLENKVLMITGGTGSFGKTVLDKFIDILEKIEQGNSDQHEASFEVGKILRDIYIDSAIKKGDKLNKGDEPQPKRESKTLSWRDWKIMNDKFADYHL